MADMPTTKHWTTKADGEVKIKCYLSGPASNSTPPTTICEILKRVCDCKKPALRVKRNGEWVTWTFRQYYNDIVHAAKSMIHLGLEPHHGVCLLGFNAPEWFIGYMAGILAGGISCGIYATNNPDECHHIADNCEANIIIAENKDQLSKILQIRDRLPHLKAIIQYSPDLVDPQQRDEGVIGWEEFMELGKDIPDYEVQGRVGDQKPGHCAALVYTSGTTGTPKGVMLSHDNLTWMGRICTEFYELTVDDHMISYLPLSHIAAQAMDIHASLHSGLTIYFAQPDALKRSLVETLKDVRPTAFVGVPRVWEKFKEKVEGTLRETTGWKEFFVGMARSVGRQTSLDRQSGQPVAWGFWLANNFVFKNMREKMGLDRCRVMGSAGAPIARSVCEFFLEFDMPIFEIYGMSESTGPQTLSRMGDHRTGAKGKLMPGVELKINNPGPNGDGEIWIRGRHVFMGYLKDERQTREAIDENGWLHSGDIGKFDDDGYLYITGRIKEILVTRGGENIAPVPIEERMKEEMKIISYCVVIGDNQKYLTMFITLRCKWTPGNQPTDQLDSMSLSILQDIRSTATTVGEAQKDPKLLEYIERGMKEANRFSGSRADKVQKFRILPVELSILGGELTPTLKMKRGVILDKYSDLLEEMYSE